MKFKLDENLPSEAVELMARWGYDVSSVTLQGLGGATDWHLSEICRKEGRTLITLDLDFADVRQFAGSAQPGLVILRLSDQSAAAVLLALSRIASRLALDPPAGRLWIVDRAGLRVRVRSL